MKIPKQIYFIHYEKDKEVVTNFLFINYICIKSALINNLNYKVNVITNNKNILNDYDIKDKVNLIIEEPIKELFGNKVTVIQHSADIRRCQLLIERGGIFCDTVILCVKSFDNVIDDDYDLIVGSETKKRLGIAFLAAKLNLQIFKDWLDNYKNFEGNKFEGYNEKDATINIKKFKYKDERAKQLNYYLKDSTYLFNELVLKDKDLKILKLSKKQTYPFSTFWMDVNDFFINDVTYPDSVIHHLWQSLLKNKLSKFSKEDLNNEGYFYKKCKEIYEVKI